jgi:hypothetical protein
MLESRRVVELRREGGDGDSFRDPLADTKVRQNLYMTRKGKGREKGREKGTAYFIAHLGRKKGPFTEPFGRQ